VAGTAIGGGEVSAKSPNIVVFFWDNLGWGEVGCYGGGVLRRRGVTTQHPTDRDS
jgi:arylsulfatase A-like enzyme